MIRNLTIHEAVWATICGHIRFTTNFTQKEYLLTIGGGIRISEIEVPNSERRVSISEALEIICQGDQKMWNWGSFLAAWEAWADGFQSGKTFARQESQNDISKNH